MTEIARDYTAKLPVETIGEIFQLVFDYNIQGYDLSTTPSFFPDVPLVLGAVATRWRDVTLNIPYLWTFIQLDLRKYVKGDDQDVNEGFLISYLRRSGNKPLRLAIVALAPHPIHSKIATYLWATVDSTVYPISLIAASRIFTFYLRSHVPWKDGGQVISLVLRFPSLQNLDINGCVSSKYKVVLDAPRLQSFHLSSCVPIDMQAGLPDSVISILLSSMDDLTTSQYPKPFVPETVGDYGLYIPAQLRSLKVESRNCTLLEFLLLQITSSALTQLAIKNCHLRRVNFLNEFLKHKGSALTTLELVDVSWRLVAWAWALRHLSSLDVLCLEETGSDGSGLTREERGDIGCVLNTLSGLRDRLPSLSRVRIRSDTLVPGDGLISFISSHVSTEPIQILLSHGTFSSTDIYIYPSNHCPSELYLVDLASDDCRDKFLVIP
jgi:hypothetical protein